MVENTDAPPGPAASEIVGPPDQNPSAMPTINFGLAIGRAASAEQVLAGKLTEGQIDKIVEQGKEDKKHQHDEHMANIGVMKLTIVVGAVVIIAIVLGFIYSGKPELLKDMFILIIGGAGGFGAGKVSSSKLYALYLIHALSGRSR